MIQATFSELRNHTKQYFDSVESGESVRILRNGKPIADIVPIQQDLSSWKRRTAQPDSCTGLIVFHAADTPLSFFWMPPLSTCLSQLLPIQ